jgi:hypothetical protein
MNNKFYDYKRDGITQSLLSTFLECREKSRLFLEGWSPKGPVSPALTYGSLIHSLLENVYADIGQRKIKSFPTSKTLEPYFQNVKKLWYSENRNASNDSRQLFEVSLSVARATLPTYFKKWWKQDTNKIKWEQLEQEFTIPYILKDARSTSVRGKIDGVFSNPKLWCFEHKSKSMINESNLMDALPLDFQVHMYLWAIQKLYKKVPSGVLYNIIRKPGSERKVKESLIEYENRIKEDIESRPDFYFIRYEISITPREQVEFSKELELLITDFIDWIEGKGRHYKRRQACITPYGKCPYLDVCNGECYVRLEKRKTIFKELEEK